MANHDEPPYLTIGTDVSAKYRGAFCEAKVKKVVRCVKCKISYKSNGTSAVVTDDLVSGNLKVGCSVEVKQSDGSLLEGIISKLTDSSMYTVVFDDGDERTLRRSQLCLKGERHFIESETLDQLPLTHPEHFGTPVMHGSKKGHKRRRYGAAEDSSDESEDESPPKKRTYVGRLQDMIGRVVCVDTSDKRKGSWYPGLIVQPSAADITLTAKTHLLVRSFKDSRFYAVLKKETKEFTRDIAIKNEEKILKSPIEKALLFLDSKELPPSWIKEELLGTDSEGDDDGEELNNDSEQACEERDRFVAELYKFMDDRGTPINKAPVIGMKDLNLYKLFKIVKNLGGYNKVTNLMKWRLVYSRMALPASNTASQQIKTAYKKYLHAFEDFHRKLGTSMGTVSRPSRSRHGSGRNVLPFRERESPKSNDSIKTEDELLCDSDTESNQSKNRGVSPQKKGRLAGKKETVIKAESAPRVLRTAIKKEKDDIVVEDDEIASEDVPKSSPRRGRGQRVRDESEDRKITAAGGKDETKSEKTKTEPETRERRASKISLKDDENNKTNAKRINTSSVKDSSVKTTATTTATTIPKTPTRMSSITEKTPSKRTLKTPAKTPSTAAAAGVKSVKTISEKSRISKGSALDKTPAKTPAKNNIKSFNEKTRKKKKDDESDKKDEKDEAKGKSKMKIKTEISTDQEMLDDAQLNTNEEEEIPEKQSSLKFDNIPIGSRLRIRYGRGRTQNIYEAKVIKAEKDGNVMQYLVHYAGWNIRYDEWIRKERILSRIRDVPSGKKIKMKTPRGRPLPGTIIAPPTTKPVLAKDVKETPKVRATKTSVSTPARSISVDASKKSNGKPAVIGSLNSGSKPRPTRSNSVEIMPYPTGLPVVKRRGARRMSGHTETEAHSQGSDTETDGSEDTEEYGDTVSSQEETPKDASADVAGTEADDEQSQDDTTVDKKQKEDLSAENISVTEEISDVPKTSAGEKNETEIEKRDVKMEVISEVVSPVIEKNEEVEVKKEKSEMVEEVKDCDGSNEEKTDAVAVVNTDLEIEDDVKPVELSDETNISEIAKSVEDNAIKSLSEIETTGEIANEENRTIVEETSVETSNISEQLDQIVADVIKGGDVLCTLDENEEGDGKDTGKKKQQRASAGGVLTCEKKPAKKRICQEDDGQDEAEAEKEKKKKRTKKKKKVDDKEAEIDEEIDGKTKKKRLKKETASESTNEEKNKESSTAESVDNAAGESSAAVRSAAGAASNSDNIPVDDHHSETGPVSTIFDNTPPTTPDGSVMNSETAMSSSSQEDDQSTTKSEQDANAEVERYMASLERKEGSESPRGGGVTTATSSDAASVEVVTSSASSIAKRKVGDQNGTEAEKTTCKKRRRSRKGGKVGRPPGVKNHASDSDEIAGRSPQAGSNTPEQSTSSPVKKRSPRPSRYNFYLDPEQEDLDREKKIELLSERISEIRKIYMQLKAEVAMIDRRRKRARRKEREALSAQQQQPLQQQQLQKVVPTVEPEQQQQMTEVTVASAATAMTQS
ncbi:uncharacterized protein LOC141912547 isoform X2 [Tubulanus polymorphus]|uniref:uncharacterized protein LOC141912547 isoform X2 n=1 Tax=Tubulanus polymorphus TaxID=672921 RepID=UPI003DA36BDA